MQKTKDWAKAVGGIVVVLVFLGGGLQQLGILPWATADSVKVLWQLKNQDNAWYRELDTKVGKIEEQVKNMQEIQKEIKQEIKNLINHIENK